jgi:hypothetical protein
MCRIDQERERILDEIEWDKKRMEIGQTMNERLVG